MLSEPASPCQCSCYSSVLGTILPKIRTLILKSFPNTQCLKKYSPGQKIRETKVFLTLPADVLRNHLIVITSTKKGNKASVMIIFTKQKNPKPISSPCSEQILSISYTQHKTTLQSAIFLKTSSINTADNRNFWKLQTSQKLRIQVRRFICKSWESILKVYLNGSYEVLNTLQVPAADKKNWHTWDLRLGKELLIF